MRWRAALFLLVLAMAGVCSAQDDDPGRFEVRSAAHKLVDGVYYVDSRIDLMLSTEAEAVLHAGVSLTIRVEVEFLNRLRFWWDITQESVSRRSQLTYYSLTDRYVVRHIETGDKEDFVTLAGALEFIGRVDNLRVVEAERLDRDRRYEVRVRAVLDKTELPGPLWWPAHWRRGWSIASDWYEWRLDEE